MKMDDIKQKKVYSLDDSFDRNTSTFIVDESVPLTEATKKLLENRYPMLVVVDQEGKVEGVVTRTDIARSVMKLNQNPLTAQSTILAATNKDFVKVLDEDNIDHLIDTIVANKFDHVIVCNKNDRLVGIVNRVKLAKEIEKLAS